MSDIDTLPVGYRYCFWAAAIGKGVLQAGLSADESLRALEPLHGLTDKYFTKEILAMIEPASQAEYEIFAAASDLDTSDLKAESFKVLTDGETFDILVKLNPSVLKAIHVANELREHNKPGATGVPIPATPSAAPAEIFEPKPDPYGNDLDPDFFRKPVAPRYAKGSAAHKDGEYNLFAY